MKTAVKKLLVRREFILFTLIILACAIFGILSEYFFLWDNIKGLLMNVSVFAIIAAGMTVLMISGGLDMSTGTHFALLGVALGIMLANGMPVLLSIVLCIGLGIADGIILGVLVTKLDVEPFITTLGAMFVFEGLAFFLGIISKVNTRKTTPSFTDFPESYLKIGGGTFLGVENINFFMIVIVVVIGVLLAKNRFFRKNMFIGGNEDASRLGGINVDFVKIFNYALVSALVAVSAILRGSRVGTISSVAGGQMMGITIIVAVIVGGASLNGGTGSVLGSVLGVILLTVIKNGIYMIGINPFYSQIIIGCILLGAVLIDQLAKMTAGKSDILQRLKIKRKAKVSQ